MKIRLTLLALFCSVVLWAQNGTVSPYSYFGLGDFRSKATVENRMMGGISMLGDSIHINLQNPAAYGALRLTTYAVGAHHKAVRFSSTTEEATEEISDRGKVTNLDYLILAFPITTKSAVAFGIMPFSNVGYDLFKSSLDVNQAEVTTSFRGSGGINRVYLAAGHQLLDGLSIGAAAHYNFGTITYDRFQSVTDVQLGTFDQREVTIGGFDVNFSLIANRSIELKGKKYRIHSMLNHELTMNLDASNTQTFGSFQTLNGAFRERIEVDLGTLAETTVVIPSKTTVGLGFGQDRKWFAGAEFSTQDMSAFKNEFLAVNNASYKEASEIKLGGYYIPNYTALNGIYNRITYRAGFRFENTGLLVEGREVQNTVLSLGFGMPIGSTASDRFSNLNVGFEFGKRSTSGDSLIDENYLGVNVGLSLNDRWFVKRRIN
ncbi:MAG: hypothetical protein O3C07_03800 [Bacteroidetes bacterium]|nr:hypothetical protein [Bacteroidota bacterium]